MGLNTAMADKLDIDAMRDALWQERTRLGQSSVATSGKRSPVTLDQQSVGRLSRMDAMQVQAMAKAEEARRQQRLRLIEAALRRIDEGEYGYCVACGDDIVPGRLVSDPASPRCVACAR